MRVFVYTWHSLSVVWNKLLKDSDGNTHHLVVGTGDTKREINITWLDTQPDELAALIQSYKAQQ